MYVCMTRRLSSTSHHLAISVAVSSSSLGSNRSTCACSGVRSLSSSAHLRRQPRNAAAVAFSESSLIPSCPADGKERLTESLSPVTLTVSCTSAISITIYML